MKKLCILGLLFSLTAFAYDPTAPTAEKIYQMQMNSFSVLNPSTSAEGFLAFGDGAAGRRFCLMKSTAGTSGSLQGSRAGTYWTVGTTPASTSFGKLTYSAAQDIFIATGFNSTTPLYLTSTDCLTWTSRTAPDANIPRATAAGPSIIVAVGGNAGNTNCAASSSATGVTWTAASITGTSCTQGFFDVVYGNNKFVAVGGNRVSTSTNGTSWTTLAAPANISYNSIAWNGKLFVIASTTFSGVTTRISTSPDGITWTARNWPFGSSADRIVWTGKYFIVNTWNPLLGFNAAYSLDGITWKGFYLPGSVYGFASDGVRVIGSLSGPPVANEALIRSIGLGF